MLHQEAHIKATKEATTVKTRQQELVRIGARKEEAISVEVRKEVAWGFLLLGLRVRGTYPCPLVCNMSGLFTICNHSLGQENMLSSTTLCSFGWDLRIDRCLCLLSWELLLCSFWLPFRAMVFSGVSVPQGYGSCVVWLKQPEQWSYWYIPVGGQGCIRHRPQKGESA